VILTNGDVLQLSALPSNAPFHLDPVTLADAERDHILNALRESKGVVGGAAGAAEAHATAVLSDFLETNREAIIAHARSRVASRKTPKPTAATAGHSVSRRVTSTPPISRDVRL